MKVKEHVQAVGEARGAEENVASDWNSELRFLSSLNSTIKLLKIMRY